MAGNDEPRRLAAISMPKPRIPKREVTLRAPEESARLEMLTQLEEILGHARFRLTLMGAFAFVVLGLLVTGAQNTHQINTQGIAYISLAKHYVHGDFGLAVSSYWSPLLTWLISGGMLAGWDDPVAARVATGLAGFAFWVGSLSLLLVCQVPIRSLLVGAWLIGLATLTWSIEYISPDLLAAALIVFASSLTLYTFRVRSIRVDLCAGLAWGLVYYANALLLPAAVLSLIGFGLLGQISNRPAARPWIRSISTQAATMLLVMVPWWGVLSSTYNEFTIGSVWRIDRAVAGPDDVNRYHPCFGDFNAPTEGRLSNWEDPARLTYTPWSPGAGQENQDHQERLLRTNVKAIVAIFLGFGSMGAAFLALASSFVFRPPLSRAVSAESWRWLCLPVILLPLAFLPLEVTPFDARFFYAAYPLSIVVTFYFIEWLPRTFEWPRFPRGFALALAAVLFAFPILPRVAASLEGMPNPGGYATLDLAERLRASQITGSVAGDGLLMGSRTGLYIATLLDQPWLGDKFDVTGTDYLASGADLIIVHRQHRVNSDMEFNPAFRDLDTVLFPDKMQAEQYPLRVYQVNR